MYTLVLCLVKCVSYVYVLCLSFSRFFTSGHVCLFRFFISSQSLGVSQSLVRLLGSTCLPSILLQKRVKNTSCHSENEEWNRLASVQVCVIWEAPPYIFRHRFGEIGPCAKHCGDFKTAESTHVQPRYVSKQSTPGSVDFQVCWRLKQYFGGTRWRSMLEIVALQQLYSRLRNTPCVSMLLFNTSCCLCKTRRGTAGAGVLEEEPAQRERPRWEDLDFIRCVFW